MSTDRSAASVEQLDPPRLTTSGPTMATRFSAVFYPRHEVQADELQRALQEAVDRVDRQMSNWNPWSDLNRLNDAPVGAWVQIPRELMTVLECAVDIERASNGAFDVGLGDVVAAWGFGPRAGHAASFARDHCRTRPGTAASLELVGDRARKRAPLDLDLSGIAKGFAVDEMARVMERQGVTSYLVGIDGEMRARGTKPGGVPWAVAHERPTRGVREAMGVIELNNRSVATSGNYRHWRERDGRSYSHTMSAQSCGPLSSGLASVTVLASDCMAADAWATALLVLGIERGLVVADRHGLDAIFVRDDMSLASSI